MERTRGSSERETEEVEELASNSRLLDRDQQRRAGETSTREESGGFSATITSMYEGGGRGGQRSEGVHRGWQGGRADRGEGNREASG